MLTRPDDATHTVPEYRNSKRELQTDFVHHLSRRSSCWLKGHTFLLAHSAPPLPEAMTTPAMPTTTMVAAPVTGAPVRRTTTRATAGVQRRRVVKKHIQQKYMLCGFAIHVNSRILSLLLLVSFLLFFSLSLSLITVRDTLCKRSL